MKKIFYISLIAIAAIPILLLGMVINHQYHVHSNAKRFPPPGEFINTNDHRLHYVCKGSGSPTIIFEPGLGSDASLIWSRIQNQVSKTNRACYYDRAGYGWSDSAKTPRTFQNQAQDLADIINATADNGPVLLVAHSIGGIITRFYAQNNLEKVAGLVLVDSSHEDQRNRWRMTKPPSVWSTLKPRYGSYLGLMRLDAHKLIPKFPWLSSEEYGRLLETASQAKYHRARLAEQNEWNAWPGASLKDMDYNFEIIPITVLSQDTRYPKLTPQNKVWEEMQLELAALSKNSHFEIVEKSGHFIPLSNPRAIVGAIQEMQTRKH